MALERCGVNCGSCPVLLGVCAVVLCDVVMDGYAVLRGGCGMVVIVCCGVYGPVVVVECGVVERLL